jgi:hypothetical protein
MICSSAVVTTAARSQLPDFKNCGRGVASVGKVRYRRVTAPLFCLEGRADGLRTSIAAVSAHGAAAFLFSCCVWFDLAVEKKVA